MKKRKPAPIWHRFNGRMYSFATVEDLKRMQIHVANQANISLVVPECIDGKLIDEDAIQSTTTFPAPPDTATELPDN